MLNKFTKLVNNDIYDDQNRLRTKIIHKVGKHKVRIDKMIAEGGYGDIYQVTLQNDDQSKRLLQERNMDHNCNKFALKRMQIDTDEPPKEIVKYNGNVMDYKTHQQK